jgi:hypothetical protein
MQGKVCPYCRRPSECINSQILYGSFYGFLWYCKKCDALVSCHKGTKEAMGRLSNSADRKWKNKAHESFDSIWKSKNESIKMSRQDAYAWLSDQLGIPTEYTHIGMFSPKTCQKVMDVVKSYKQDIKQSNRRKAQNPTTE